MNCDTDPVSVRSSGVAVVGRSGNALELLVGLVAGAVAALMHVWIGFRLGTTLSLWAAVTFVLVSFLVSWMACGFRRMPAGWMPRWLTMIGLLGLGVWVSGLVYGVNWDGMLAHKEFVVALDRGWNPLEDPYRDKSYRKDNWDWELYAQWRGLANAGFEVRHGFVLGAIAAKVSGNPESGKSVHLMYAMVAAFAVWHYWTKLGVNGWRRILYAAACVLNPVVLVQLPSFWLDGQVASLVAAAVFLALSIRVRGRYLEWIALVLVLILLSNTKRAGGALLLWILAGVLLSHGALVFDWMRMHRKVAWIGVVLAFVAAGIMGGSAPGREYIGRAERYLESMVSLQRIGEWEWVSEAQRKGMPKLTRLNGIEQFLASSLSESTMVPQDVHLKMPLAFTAPERSVFYHGFAGLWYGGFGPWFGLALLFALALSLIAPRLYWKVPGGPGFWALWLWVPLLIIPGIFSRWIPWMWLFPVLCGTGFDYLKRSLTATGGEIPRPAWWLSHRSFWVRGFGAATLMILLLNAVVVWGLNVAGHVRSTGILNEQLRFLKAYPEVEWDVHFKDFPSNRTWLEHLGIKYKAVSAPPLDHWQLRLYRTTTTIALPKGMSPDDGDSDGRIPIRLRDLADGWDQWGRGDPSWPWIGPSLIEPVTTPKKAIGREGRIRPVQSE